jgi:hypothetical protein
VGRHTDQLDKKGEYMKANTRSQVEVDPYFLRVRQLFLCNASLNHINYWLTAVLFKFLPCIFLTILMALLVRTLFEARERNKRLRV